jgi:riboflavin biosynthesis pyrimidine reductase
VSQAFGEFATRKTHQALAALMPRYVTVLDAPDPSSTAIGNEWTRSLFDGSFYVSPPRSHAFPACSLVFVQSRDGNTGTHNPSSLGGGQTDTHLIYEGLSRVGADAVLAGANTVRGANLIFSVWHPELVRLRAALGKPRHPIQIVATNRGLELDRGLLFNVPEVAVIILTTAAGAGAMRKDVASRPWIAPVIRNQHEDLRGAFEQLRARGIDRVSAVGGRNIAAQLIDAGLVQDVYLTTAPRDGGEPGTPMYPGPLKGRVAVRKTGTGPEAGVVFEHLMVEGSEGRPGQPGANP